MEDTGEMLVSLSLLGYPLPAILLHEQSPILSSILPLLHLLYDHWPTVDLGMGDRLQIGYGRTTNCLPVCTSSYLTITSLLASYTSFFTLATYVTGFMSENNPKLKPGLYCFYFGQMWLEFGYRKNEFKTLTSMLVGKWTEGHLEYPHVNSTLDYVINPSEQHQ